jgi:hypothetical protein
MSASGIAMMKRITAGTLLPASSSRRKALTCRCPRALTPKSGRCVGPSGEWLCSPAKAPSIRCSDEYPADAGRGRGGVATRLTAFGDEGPNRGPVRRGLFVAPGQKSESRSHVGRDRLGREIILAAYDVVRGLGRHSPGGHVAWVERPTVPTVQQDRSPFVDSCTLVAPVGRATRNQHQPCDHHRQNAQGHGVSVGPKTPVAPPK